MEGGFHKNQKKVLNGWAMYDWANSAYSLIITVAIFPAYFTGITDDYGFRRGRYQDDGAARR